MRGASTLYGIPCSRADCRCSYQTGKTPYRECSRQASLLSPPVNTESDTWGGRIFILCVYAYARANILSKRMCLCVCMRACESACVRYVRACVCARVCGRACVLARAWACVYVCVKHKLICGFKFSKVKRVSVRARERVLCIYTLAVA